MGSDRRRTVAPVSDLLIRGARLVSLGAEVPGGTDGTPKPGSTDELAWVS